MSSQMYSNKKTMHKPKFTDKDDYITNPISVTSLPDFELSEEVKKAFYKKLDNFTDDINNVPDTSYSPHVELKPELYKLLPNILQTTYRDYVFPIIASTNKKKNNKVFQSEYRERKTKHRVEVDIKEGSSQWLKQYTKYYVYPGHPDIEEHGLVPGKLMFDDSGDKFKVSSIRAIINGTTYENKYLHFGSKLRNNSSLVTSTGQSLKSIYKECRRSNSYEDSDNFVQAWFAPLDLRSDGITVETISSETDKTHGIKNAVKRKVIHTSHTQHWEIYYIMTDNHYQYLNNMGIRLYSFDKFTDLCISFDTNSIFNYRFEEYEVPKIHSSKTEKKTRIIFYDEVRTSNGIDQVTITNEDIIKQIKCHLANVTEQHKKIFKNDINIITERHPIGIFLDSYNLDYNLIESFIDSGALQSELANKGLSENEIENAICAESVDELSENVKLCLSQIFANRIKHEKNEVTKQKENIIEEDIKICFDSI